MGNWVKVKGKLHFKIVSILIQKKIRQEFQITWSRGKHKGECPKSIPDDQTNILVNEVFDVPITIYSSPKEKSVYRPKLLHLKLFKISHTGVPMYYARCDLDVSKYFDSPDPSKVQVDMISGQANPPKITLGILVERNGQHSSQSVESINLDSTEENPSNTNPPQEKENSYSEKNSDSPSDNKDQDTNLTYREQYILDQKPSSKRPEFQRGTPKIVHLNGTPVIQEEIHSNKQSNQLASNPNAPSNPPRRVFFSPSVSNPPPKAQNSSSKMAPQKSELCIAYNALYLQSLQSSKKQEQEIIDEDDPALLLFQSILSREYPIREAVYADSDNLIPFPPAVFPIISTIFETKLLSNTISEYRFNYYLDRFISLYLKAPLQPNCSNEVHFLTTLFIIFILMDHRSTRDYLFTRVQAVENRLSVILNKYALELVKDYLFQFEVMIDRFASAKFEVSELLYDFCNLLNSIQSSFQYTIGINFFLAHVFLNAADSKIIERILSNPCRLNYSCATVWVSFSTAFEHTTKFQMKYLHQLASVIMMAPNLNQTPNLIKEIAPDMSPRLILYILKNFRPDEMFNEKIQYNNFISEFKLDESIQSYDPVRPIEVKLTSEMKEDISSKMWAYDELTQPLIDTFPFLQDYIED